MRRKLDQHDYSARASHWLAEGNAAAETADHPAIVLGMQLMMIGDLSTPDKMRQFIKGFN